MNDDKNDDITIEVEYFFKKVFEWRKKSQKLPLISKNFNWYVEPSIKLKLLKKLFQEHENEKQVDEILSKHYKENIERIFNDLKNTFPNRSGIFDEIFYAHKKKLYYLSSIALMTQIDGIVYDFFDGKNYFQGTGKDDFFNPMKDRLNNINDKSFGVYFLKQLFNDELPIKFSKGKRDKILEFNHINRHQIIHGETTDFNTEINSLKTLSLLATLAFTLEYLDDLIQDGDNK